MKKILFTLLLVFSFSTIVQSQEISNHAIGLRLGDSDGFGAEVSYQKLIKNNKRIEADLGWRGGKGYHGFKLTGLYQLVWHIDGGFNWYAGAGGGLGTYSFNNKDIDSETFVFVAGDVGIEYNFDIPLLLSLDFRPELGFGDFRNDVDFDIALGIRYQF